MALPSTWLAAATAAVLCSCAPEGVADRGVTVRDSAGMTVVERLEPAWVEGERWQPSPEPMLHIGVVDGDPVYRLNDGPGEAGAEPGRRSDTRGVVWHACRIAVGFRQ